MRHIKRRFFYILLSYLEFFFGDSLLHLVCNLRVVFMSKNCSLGIWMSLEQMLICENEIYSTRQNFCVESGMEGKPNFSPISRILRWYLSHPSTLKNIQDFPTHNGVFRKSDTNRRARTFTNNDIITRREIKSSVGGSQFHIKRGKNWTPFHYDSRSLRK